VLLVQLPLQLLQASDYHPQLLLHLMQPTQQQLSVLHSVVRAAVGLLALG
jgi:hypothetical protein